MTKPFKSDFDLIQQFKDYFKIQSFEPILQWATKYINFSDDVSAQRNSLDLELTPHLKEILSQWNFAGKIKEVTVVGIEQHRQVADVGDWFALFDDLLPMSVNGMLPLGWISNSE